MHAPSFSRCRLTKLSRRAYVLIHPQRLPIVAIAPPDASKRCFGPLAQFSSHTTMTPSAPEPPLDFRNNPHRDPEAASFN